MKRIRFLAIVLALSFMFTAVACTDDQTNGDSTQAVTDEQTTAGGESSPDPFVNDKDHWD